MNKSEAISCVYFTNPLGLFVYCQHCYRECEKTEQCTDFTWHSPAAEIFPLSCFLFSSCDHMAASHGCFSGNSSSDTLTVRLRPTPCRRQCLHLWPASRLWRSLDNFRRLQRQREVRAGLPALLFTTREVQILHLVQRARHRLQVLLFPLQRLHYRGHGLCWLQVGARQLLLWCWKLGAILQHHHHNTGSQHHLHLHHRQPCNNTFWGRKLGFRRVFTSFWQLEFISTIIWKRQQHWGFRLVRNFGDRQHSTVWYWWW